MTDTTHTSTENPPGASGLDLVEDAEQAAGPTTVAAAPASGDVVSTENPPHAHGAAVVDNGDRGEPVAEAPVQSPTQAGGLHAADVTGLEEQQVG